MCVGITREALSVLCYRQQHVPAVLLVKSKLLQSLLVLVFAVQPSPVNPLPAPLMVWTMWLERLFQLPIPVRLAGELVHFYTAFVQISMCEDIHHVPISAFVQQMAVGTAV